MPTIRTVPSLVSTVSPSITDTKATADFVGVGVGAGRGAGVGAGAEVCAGGGVAAGWSGVHPASRPPAATTAIAPRKTVPRLTLRA